MTALQTLLNSIVDYAGLFPPSKLDMLPAVRNFAEHDDSPHSWMLARFVLPVSRFEEFELIADRYLPRGEDAAPWPISALVGADLDGDIDRIFEFNRRHAGDDDDDVGLAVVDSIELKATSAEFIDDAMQIVPEQLSPYFEIPWDMDPRGWIAALAGTGGRAKIRCGGVTHDLFPPVDAVARFIVHCAAATVPFKFTAGLHHPIRAEHRLTYADDAPTGTMHGFLNAFLAAAYAKARRFDQAKVEAVLSETDPAAFVIERDFVAWRGERLDVDALARIREEFATSFGSCSFVEPVEDLQTLSLLHA